MDDIVIRKAVTILYNLNRVIELFESIGVNIEGNINGEDVGGYIYGATTEAYEIIEKELNVNEDKHMRIAEIVEILYINDDSKENKINECIRLLKELKE